MNALEKLVYDSVKSNPKLKQVLRNCYQFFFDVLPRRKEFSIAPIAIKEGFFFGFHDLQPFSEDSKFLLANRLDFDLRMPMRGESVEVGYIGIDNGELSSFTPLGRSFAWNYHKGCRLQWCGGDNSKIVYNSANSSGETFAIIRDLISEDEELLPCPIDSVSKSGKLATSFSFQRLEEYMPGYGYPYLDDHAYVSEKAPRETGLFVVDLESKTRKLIVDLQHLASMTLDEPSSKESFHYVTHTAFSHDSRYISFLHRWVGSEKQKRFTKLMVYDLLTNELKQLPLTRSMASHYTWNDKHEIVAYCSFDGKDCHALFDVEDISNSKPVAYPDLNSDGHQSFVNSTSFITDTYPDKWRMAKLFSVDVAEGSVRKIAAVYSPRRFQTKDFKKHIACDLHPRVASRGDFVCFDTVKSGKRAIAIMRLK